MGDIDAARENLSATLTRVQRYGIGFLLAGLVGAATVVRGLGVAVAILGLAMIVGSAFAKGYYLD